VGIVVVVGVIVVVVAAIAGGIVSSAKKKRQHNASFLATAVFAQDLPVQTSVPTNSGAPYAIWLDLELAANATVTFQLALAVEVGGTRLLDGTYPVTFDDNDEHDAKGLPNPPGISALNTTVVALPGNTKITTVLRAFRFDVPAGATAMQVRASIVPGPGVTATRAHLLVTSPDAPSGSGALPAGMRALPN
jgi:hypothetical protein